MQMYGGKIMRNNTIVIICLLIVFTFVICSCDYKTEEDRFDPSSNNGEVTQGVTNETIVLQKNAKAYSVGNAKEDVPVNDNMAVMEIGSNSDNASAKGTVSSGKLINKKNSEKNTEIKPDEKTSSSQNSNFGNKTKQLNADNNLTEGYRDVCYDGTSYIAVGTNGRIDRIMPDKTVISISSPIDITLNGIIYVNGINIAVGENGIILVSMDGSKFRTVNSGVDADLYDITLYRSAFWVAGSGGILLRSSDGEHWNAVQTGTDNDIISISANNRMCMAVTREGQILMTKNGREWDILDYNEVYKGYDEPYWFHSIRALGDTFFLAGEYQRDSGIPVIMSSATGEVWRPYPMTEINGESMDNYLPIVVNVVGISDDQILVACNDGKIITLTDCMVCHKLTKASDYNIKEMALADGKVVVVGDDFWFDILSNNELHQYKIRPEKALEDFLSGAYIVDVRTAEEYKESHIKGCVHIPIDQIENVLERIIPDKSKKIIFYCAKGSRSQQAVEKALELGYRYVYNLGGINDWPYEKTSGSEGSFSFPEN